MLTGAPRYDRAGRNSHSTELFSLSSNYSHPCQQKGCPAWIIKLGVFSTIISCSEHAPRWRLAVAVANRESGFEF